METTEYEKNLAAQRQRERELGDKAKVKIAAIGEALGLEVKFDERLDEYGMRERVADLVGTDGLKLRAYANGWKMQGRVQVYPLLPAPKNGRLVTFRDFGLDKIEAGLSLDKDPAKAAAEISRRVVTPWLAVKPKVDAKVAAEDAYDAGVKGMQERFGGRVNKCSAIFQAQFSDDGVSFKTNTVPAETFEKILALLEGGAA